MTSPRIRSLWDHMREIDVGKIAWALGSLSDWLIELDQLPPRNVGEKPTLYLMLPQRNEHLRVAAGCMAEQAQHMGLPVTESLALRLHELILAKDEVEPWELGNMADHIPYTDERRTNALNALRTLVGAAPRELSARLVYSIPAEHAHLLRSDKPLFGEAVDGKFFKARDDIEEAGKALALGRNTACVFHSMRAAEVAVRALGKRIKATVKDHKGEPLAWGVVAANIATEIKKISVTAKKDKWHKVHTHMESMNRAYRTKTAHPGAKYIDEEAQRAFDMTRNFMQEAASLL